MTTKTAYLWSYCIMDITESEVTDMGISPTLEHAKECIVECLLDLIPCDSEIEERIEHTVLDMSSAELDYGRTLGSRSHKFIVYARRTAVALTEDVLIAGC